MSPTQKGSAQRGQGGGRKKTGDKKTRRKHNRGSKTNDNVAHVGPELGKVRQGGE